MNILKTYVLRNLKNNKVRTIMTIAGIILSVALITAVVEGGFSGLEYLRNIMKDTYGDFHGYAFNLDLDGEYELITDEKLEGHAELETVGWADIGSANSTKPYLLIKAASDNIRDFLKVDIISGRFPENENEILLPQHLSYNGDVHYNVGDTITLTLGVRGIDGKTVPDSIKFTDGEMLYEKGSEHAGETRTYTVCGIMDRLNYQVEDYLCPGYTAIVLLDGNKDIDTEFNGQSVNNRSVLFRLKDPRSYNAFATAYVRNHPGASINKNSELVGLYGGAGSRSIMLFINGFVGLLIGLILFGSISLVYNSFSISINERTRQIGILKSVGATKKQIRKTVFYEAFFESITAVPLGLALGCIGMGATFWLLENAFAMFLRSMLGYTSENVKISIVVNIPLLLVGILVVLVSTMLSAAIPAYRASKVSPIDLVRQSDDISIKGKKIRGSRLFSKLFGAEGMLASKNYSRNRKKYRATIVSLSVSIVLFIAASSFCSYLTKATDIEFYYGNASLVYYYDEGVYDLTEKKEKKDPYEIKAILDSAESVRKAVAINSLNSFQVLSENAYAADIPFEEIETGEIDESLLEDYIYSYADLKFIDDESFDELVKELGITYVPESDGAKSAIIYNAGSYYTYDEEGNRKKVEYKYIEDEQTPKKYTVEWYTEYNMPGRLEVNQAVDENGEVYCVFIDEEYADEYFNMLYDGLRYNLAERKIVECLMEELYGSPEIPEDYPYLYDIEYYSDSTVEAVNGEIMSEEKEKAQPFTEKELALFDHITFEKRADLTHRFDVNIVGITYDKDYAFTEYACILLPFSAVDEKLAPYMMTPDYYMFADDATKAETDVSKILIDRGMDTSGLYNFGNEIQGRRMIGRIVSVFAYGFILLISLVSITNVFNTISTNVALRRREFAIFKSMGLSNKGVSKILNIECLIYGLKSILIGIPLSIPVTFLVYKITNQAFKVQFSIPWISVLIASVSVFVVVFITMLYASGKIRKDNTIDALRNENT